MLRRSFINKLFAHLVPCNERHSFFRKHFVKLAEHNIENAEHFASAELSEHNNFINSVEKFRAEDCLQRTHNLFTSLAARAFRKPYAAALPVASGVAGHHNNGVFKADNLSVTVRHASVVKYLQKNIHNIGVSLFNLIEQNHAVRLSANLFGELPGVIVPDISRGRTDKL